MRYDPHMTWLLGRRANTGIVTVSVIYFLPDYNSLLNEFHWQTMDERPEYPRIKSFIEYWQKEIEATIREIRINDGKNGWRSAKGLFQI